MKEEWLFPNAIVPVDVETTAALVAEIHRLIGVVGGMALAQPEPLEGLKLIHKADIDLAKKRALEAMQAQPEPSPEWMTEEEQTAYTFGWFKALESKRVAQPEQEPVGRFAKFSDGLWREVTEYSDGVMLYTSPPQPKQEEKNNA